jgi:hypothetical protein
MMRTGRQTERRSASQASYLAGETEVMRPRPDQTDAHDPTRMTAGPTVDVIALAVAQFVRTQPYPLTIGSPSKPGS